MHYKGRFAPSPTGPLHLGSLLAALISYIDARSNNGSWLVRIEDIDPPREAPGASESILNTLEAYGFEWDEPVVYQSKRYDLYESKLKHLLDEKHCYYCPCSRKEMAELNGGHLPECGYHSHNTRPNSAIKFRSNTQPRHWNDLFKGPISARSESDFVLKRKDALYAYQLAVVTDDIDQGITHVLRGADLLDSSPMQLELYKAFSTTPPKFGHFPLIKNSDGQKLSKQNLAPAISQRDIMSNLRELCRMIGLDFYKADSPKDLLNTLTEQWHYDVLQGHTEYLFS
jgi:glutamyl-Q tRNA(Asp) synthetase